jgi:putative iron-only hydrogenase system regulator
MNNAKERRVGVVSIIVYNPNSAYQKLNQILHEFSPLILGRLGFPYRERHLSIIALIVDGSTDEIGAMTGQIGQLPSVTVRTSFAKQ